MPDQFVVPQFIDAEDTIFGPVTARQFIILMVVFLTDFALFKLLSFVMFLIVGISLLILGGVVAFVRINGQPFHYFFLNLIQTFKRPGLRVWNKVYSNAEVRALTKQEPLPPHIVATRKSFTATTRLQELALVVNTGGVYKPED